MMTMLVKYAAARRSFAAAPIDRPFRFGNFIPVKRRYVSSERTIENALAARKCARDLSINIRCGDRGAIDGRLTGIEPGIVLSCSSSDIPIADRRVRDEESSFGEHLK
jgi:hypothetical protein